MSKSLPQPTFVDRDSHPEPEPEPGGRKSFAALWAFLSLAFLLLILASGRISSGDAGTQLQAATVFARTGSLGLTAPPENDNGLWVKAPNGSFYQCHDPGNLLLMVLPAWLASKFDGRPDAEAFAMPPLPSKLLVSFLYALLGAWSAWTVQELASKRSNRRRGLLIGLVSLFCTLAIAYSRAAWDVMAGYAFVWWHVKASLDLAEGGHWKTRKILELAVATSLALWFRYSLAPFLIVSLVGQAWSQRGKWKFRQIGAAILLGTFLMAPVFAYNDLRMGSPLVPATRHVQFEHANGLHGDILSGGGALLFSPNRGLLFYAPVFLLLPAALIGLWRSGSLREKSTVGWMLLAAGAYIAMIAKMNNPCAFGWGPRYLLPILPLLFAPIALDLASKRKWPASTRILLGVSALVNVPTVFANWHSAAIGSGMILKQWSWPRHQWAIWQSIWTGLRGFEPASRTVGQEGFPNFWWWQLGSMGRAGAVLATIFVVGLTCGVVFSLRAWRKAS